MCGHCRQRSVESLTSSFLARGVSGGGGWGSVLVERPLDLFRELLSQLLLLAARAIIEEARRPQSPLEDAMHRVQTRPIAMAQIAMAQIAMAQANKRHNAHERFCLASRETGFQHVRHRLRLTEASAAPSH